MIDSELCLCDCPGLVFPNFVSSRAEMILNGILSVDNATDPLSAVSLITDVVPEHVLRATYNLFLPTSGEGSDSHPSLTAREFLEAYGRKYRLSFIHPNKNWVVGIGLFNSDIIPGSIRVCRVV
ncbi:large subunit GTPase 1 homolog [Centruroides sculpturatus]|uniref:large subunit GTPase 1 homolog n=1 Tax=Centruroides sculpturatus TaxID=218467 RepID=UPI000C6D2289|nr:large subunit GTPase 1 homolog [Centruroides sculpturatus]